MIGWTLIWLSANKNPDKQQPKIQQPKTQEDNVTLMVIAPSEEQEVTILNKDN
jgi:hypothetical protein